MCTAVCVVHVCANVCCINECLSVCMCVSVTVISQLVSVCFVYMYAPMCVLVIVNACIDLWKCRIAGNFCQVKISPNLAPQIFSWKNFNPL